MSESILKHFGEQGDSHKGPLYWGGDLNLPFRGAYAPTLTQEELETQVGISSDFNWALLDLSNKEDGDKYQWIMDRVVNRWFALIHQERKLIAEEKTVIVYIEWTQRYRELSPAAKAARSQGYVFQRPNQAESAIIPIGNR